MARRSDHSPEKLADLILNAAVMLVDKGGKPALTARSVAAEIGYTPGTLYNVYGSMDVLILHLNARTMDALYNALTSVTYRKKPDSINADILKMADAYRNFIAVHKNAWLLLFDVTLPSERATLLWYQSKVARLFEPLETLLAPAFKKQDAHKFHMSARILWSSFHGLCYLEEKGQFHTVGKNASVAEMTKFLVENFMNGIARP